MSFIQCCSGLPDSNLDQFIHAEPKAKRLVKVKLLICIQTFVEQPFSIWSVKVAYSVCVRMCVCVCLYVCERERKGLCALASRVTDSAGFRTDLAQR